MNVLPKFTRSPIGSGKALPKPLLHRHQQTEYMSVCANKIIVSILFVISLFALCLLFTISATAQPVIASFSPQTAGTGNTVTIKGSHLTEVTEVLFGNVPASSFATVDETTLTAVVGAGATGDVAVTTGGGSASAKGFTYVPPPHILSFSPTGAMPGSTVTITGTNLTDITSITFGNIPAVQFTRLSSTSMTAVVGTGASGSIRLTTQYGKDSATGFTLIQAPLPVITSFSPMVAAAGATVTILGEDFNTTAADNIVYFGAAKATVKSATATSLQVTVPAGATYQPISVTTKNLTAYSSAPFLLSFGGSGYSFDETSFGDKVLCDGGENVSQVAIADFDNDGRPDIAAVNFYLDLVVIPNTSTVGKLSFGKSTHYLSPTANTYFISTADFDGDGKTDIAVTATFQDFYILRNTSTKGAITFAEPQRFSLSGDPAQLATGDIDGDGKPDLVIVFLNGQSFGVFPNTSVPGFISFGAAHTYSMQTDAAGLYIAVADLNGDNKPDVAMSGVKGTLSLFTNMSTKGSFGFAPDISVPAYSMATITIGNLDGDAKPDLITSNLFDDNSVSVYKNVSGAAGLLFADKQDYSAGLNPDLASVGDLDGDGKPDVVAGNHYFDGLSVYRNNSRGGNVALEPEVRYRPQQASSNHVAIADMDGDGLPDLVSADLYQSISVLRNTGKGLTNLVLCEHSQTELLSDVSGSSYQWQVNKGEAFTDIADDEHYKGTNTSKLTLTDVPAAWDGYLFRCVVGTKSSSVTKLVVEVAAQPSVSITATAEAICSGTDVSFTATPDNAGEPSSYRWMVNGKAQQASAVSFTTTKLADKDEVYVIMTTETTCESAVEATSDRITMSVSSTAPPAVSIAATSTSVCEGTAITFTATAQNGGTNPAYVWLVNNRFTGTAGNTYNSSTLGNGDVVKVKIRSSEACALPDSAFSNEITVMVNPTLKPAGAINLPATVCVNDEFEVGFTSTSLATEGATIELWESVNGGAFEAAGDQLFEGSALHFPLHNTGEEATKRYFFSLSLPANTACAVAGNTDTATTKVQQLPKPLLSVATPVISLSNAATNVAYNWQVMDGSNWKDILPAETGTSYTATVSGTYRVQATMGSCNAVSEAAEIVITPVAPPPSPSESTDSIVVRAYPNPSGSFLIIDNLKTLDGWEQLEIVNASGRLCLPVIKVSNQTTVKVNVSGLAGGTYFAVLKRSIGAPVTIRFLKL